MGIDLFEMPKLYFIRKLKHNEPAHDKTYNKIRLVWPVKTQISLCIYIVWSVFTDHINRQLPLAQ